MIYLDLFLTFLLIGSLAFGGGYGMIPLVRSLIVEKGWMTAEEISNIIAIAESTPGPIAVNMATYVGSVQGAIDGNIWGSLLGSFLATFAVVLPAFLIIVLIATVLKNFNENKYVNAFLDGVKPIIVALILSTGALMMIQCVYVNFGVFTEAPSFAWQSLALIAGLIAVRVLYKKIFKKQISPIILIIIAAGVGMLIF